MNKQNGYFNEEDLTLEEAKKLIASSCATLNYIKVTIAGYLEGEQVEFNHLFREKVKKIALGVLVQTTLEDLKELFDTLHLDSKHEGVKALAEKIGEIFLDDIGEREGE